MVGCVVDRARRPKRPWSGSRSTPRRSARGATGSSPTVSTVSTTVPAETRHVTEPGSPSVARRVVALATPTPAGVARVRTRVAEGSAHGRHDAHCNLPRAQCVHRLGVGVVVVTVRAGLLLRSRDEPEPASTRQDRTEQFRLRSVPPNCRWSRTPLGRCCGRAIRTPAPRCLRRRFERLEPCPLRRHTDRFDQRGLRRRCNTISSISIQTSAVR